MNQKYKEPILAQLYQIAGYIVIVVGLLASIGTGFGSGILPALTVLGGTLLLTLPLLGIAQLISFIGKTAYYSELIHNSITTSTYQTSKALGEISRRLQASSMREVTDPSAPLESPIGAVCPYCNANIPATKVQKGENFCPECKNSFIAE